MARRPRTGALTERVSFEQRSSAADGLGGTIDSWVAVFSTAAEFIHLRGGETVQAARLSGTHTQVIRIRASALARTVTSGWRITDSRTGVSYNVRSIEPHVDRRWIDFLCQSGVAT